MSSLLTCGRFQLDLTRPRVMGIVNLTDDSFSGDGLAGQVAAAVEQGWRMKEEGADLLDLGAESSRPGAAPVSADQELARLLPVIRELRNCGLPLSVDTVKPAVMEAVLAEGADLINDIAALTAPGALEIVARSSAAVCLMHMQGQPGTMQQNPTYVDVVKEVRDFLDARVQACLSAGIALERLVLDPGFGFGKSLEHNLELLRRLDETTVHQRPILAGISRKSMLGQITGKPVADRLAPTIAVHLLAAQQGARIIRVHDVAAARDSLAVLNAFEQEGH